jgi:C-terminal processing protease CtpA/Prc
MIPAYALALAFSGPGCAAEHGTIGAIVAQRNDGRLFVRDVPPSLAADKAGLRPNDEIILIDGADVRAMDAAHVHQALSGDVGEPVNLTVVRGNEVLRVTLRRTESKKYATPEGSRP